MYYAHSKPDVDKSHYQPLINHLQNVANLAARFASDFNAGDLAYTGGLLHDIGKYSKDFQRRLNGERLHVDHSTAGAREAESRYPSHIGMILEYIISGHHGGLPNYGSDESGLIERLRKGQLPDYSAFRKEIEIPGLTPSLPRLKSSHKEIGFAISFYIRMLYSCLVDADSLDTECFENPERTSIRNQFDSIDNLFEKFSVYMDRKIAESENSMINKFRIDIYEQCKNKATLPPQFFSLTVPTGGGKTLSSMAFALAHVKNHNLNRIFYIIPYTSIIEQNAKVFRDIFGSKNVLEHHSNFDPLTVDTDDMDRGVDSLRLSTDNWDIPIVVTTNVQFFESLFSNRRSRCRKLHNLSKSVIILDEAQMLPTEYLKPCLAALTELVRNYGSTIVICTATQPKLGDLLDKDFKPHEIIRSPERLYESFKRVKVTDLGPLSDEELSIRLKGHRQVLCVVNTRNHAKNLFAALHKFGNCHHLSARMCPVHRRKKIKEIKKLLSEGEACQVISTQLIEAGVDIDFPFVYRASTGIDSIAQAAGRCNREGKMSMGDVYLFKSTERYGKATSWQNLVAEIGEMTFQKYEEDPLSLSSVAEYFGQLYHYKGEEGLDSKKILPAFEERSNELAFPFEDVAEAFRIIERGTFDLVIPYDEGAQSIISDLRYSETSWRFARQLQGYTVSIYPNEFREFVRRHVVELLGDRFYVLKSREDYSDETGLLDRTEIGTDGSLMIV